LSVGLSAGPSSRDGGIWSVWNVKKGATPGTIKEQHQERSRSNSRRHCCCWS